MPSTTSITSALNDEIVVPWMTDRAVQCMPACTSESGMIGAAASALGAVAMLAPRVARMSARRLT